MKRVGGIFEQIGTRAVLSEAFRRAAAGKRHLDAVRAFERDLDGRLGRIASQVLDGTYAFGPYDAFRVQDGKSRVIHAPTLEQRVVHHAIVLAAGPALERGAVATSFACRKGLGHARALAYAREQVRRHGWFLHIDIASYYDSVPHALLENALERRFRERRLLDLFARLLDSYHTRSGYGLPMGALTSQHLGNFFLDAVDHWALDVFRVGSYARYMDDIGAWGEHDRLAECRLALSERLGSLELTAKNGGNLNRCAKGMTFLGFTLRPCHMRLHRRARKRLRSKLSALHRDFRKGGISEEVMRNRGTSLFAWARQADDLAWRRSALRQHYDFGDALDCAAGDPRRQLRESGRELPVRQPQQEAARP